MLQVERPRVIVPPVKDAIERIVSLPEGEQAGWGEQLGVLVRAGRENPLELFTPTRRGRDGKYNPHDAQLRFFDARTKTVCATAGNRFGKSTALVVRALVECLDVGFVPEHLREFKRFDPEVQPVYGRIVCPQNGLIESNVLKHVRQWCPPAALRGGSVDSAWSGQRKTLSFKNGSVIDFMSYEQTSDKFESVRLHFVGFDEPPPRDIRVACMTRLGDYDGYEMFACTLINSNVGWFKREIVSPARRSGNEHITLIEGTTYDNALISDGEIERWKELMTEAEVEARIFGRAPAMEGLVFPEVKDALCDLVDRGFVSAFEFVVVAIDPSLKNTAVVWIGFTKDNVAFVFDEMKVHDQTPDVWAQSILQRNEIWGVREKDVDYVIDPFARHRSNVNAVTIQSVIQDYGIFAMAGQNNIEAGVLRVRTRLRRGDLKVCSNCVKLLEEAESYEYKEDAKGRYVPSKGPGVQDHLMDALRYGIMVYPYEDMPEKFSDEFGSFRERLEFETGGSWYSDLER